MDTPVSNDMNQQPKKKSLLPIIAVVAIVAIIIGIVVYFMSSNKSVKDKYFLAEKESTEAFMDYFKDRYEPELNWTESTMEKPTETDYTVGVQLDSTSGLIDAQTADLVNSSQLKLYSGTDYDNKIATAAVDVNVGPFAINDLNIGLTEDVFSLKIPFVDETWTIEESDLPDFLNNLDPTIQLEEGDINFSDLFEQSAGISEENRKYLEDEYLKFVYDKISEDSFTEDKENVTVNGQDFNAEVIELHLSDDEIIEIIQDVTEKAKNDDKLIEIIAEEFAVQQLSSGVSSPQLSGAISEDFEEEFKEAMDELHESANDINMPDGLTSKIWISDNQIVKRDLEFSFEGEYEEGTLNLVGEQVISKDGLFADYSLFVDDHIDEVEITFNIDSTVDGDQATDVITFGADGEFTLTYESDETLNKNKRDYERILFVADDANSEQFRLNWTGNAQYDKDKMRSENDVQIDIEELGGELFSLQINKDAKHVKSIEAPDTENVVNIGAMDMNELMEYFETEVAPAIQQNLGF